MLSMLTSSTMIGYCCGAVVGGLLSDRFSYSVVFFISAVVITLAVPLLKMSGLDSIDRCRALSIGSMASMVRSPDVIGYPLLIILPLYAGGMFISYSLPIFGAKNGLAVTMIAGLIMLNSLLAAYLAPFMSKPANLGASDSMAGLTLSGKAGQSVAPVLLSAAGGAPGIIAAVLASGTVLYMLVRRVKVKSVR